MTPTTPTPEIEEITMRNEVHASGNATATTILITLLITIIILLGLEYFYQIPSRFFV